MIFRLFWIWLLLLGLASAQPSKQKVNHVEVELLAGANSQLGIRFRPDPHWHVYWQNPGATGLAPQVTWKLPSGWKAGPLQWPVPSRQVILDLHQFIYEGEVVLPASLQMPSGAKGKVVAEVSWLACEESCLPGKATLSLDLPANPTEWKVDLPQPSPSGISAWRSGPKSAILTGLPDASDFFPLSNAANLESAPKKVAQGLEIPIQAEDKRLTGVVKSGTAGFSIDLELGSAPTGPKTAAAAPAPSITLWGALLASFVGGMILNLMPCVFPVLSLKALSLVYQNEDGPKAQWLQGGVYTAGVLVSVWLLAAPILLLRKGSQPGLGWGYQMQSPLFVFIMAALFLLIALNLFGLFEVGEGLTKLGSLAEKKKGLSEPFWSGAVATVAATPCTGPFMAAALGYAVAQSAWVALAIFTMLGLGMALPYLLLCGFPATRSWLPRPGAWMETFKQAMGFPMLLAMVWFVYILSTLVNSEALGLMLAGLLSLSLAGWIWGRWGYSSWATAAKSVAVTIGIVVLALIYQVSQSPAFLPATLGSTSQHGGLTWEPFSPQRVEQLRSEGKAIFVDFTASWCVNCKVNELGPLRNAKVLEAFKNSQIVTLKADWTRRDPVISKTLESFGRTGVPLYVVYPRQGEPLILPELLTPQILLDALAKV
jgi:thiol:disulfide interchange protein